MRRTFLAVAASLAFAAGASEPKVCGKCGCESLDARARFCGHCGAALNGDRNGAPARQESARRVARETPAPDAARVPARQEKDRHPARAKPVPPSPEMEYFAARNDYALAAGGLLRAGAGAGASGTPLERMNAAMRKLVERETECPACAGKGKREIKPESLGTGGALGSRPLTARKLECKACGGRGRIVLRRPDVAAASLRRAQAEHAAALNASGRTDAGWAFLDEDQAGEPVRRRVAVAATFAVPCQECFFTGETACPKCRGAGLVKCTNRDCRDGLVEIKSSFAGSGVSRRGGGSSRTMQSTMKKCETCGGASMVRCDGCRGRGAVVCRKCRGDGLAPKCAKCGGGGIASCGVCGGKGSFRGPEGGACRACDGTGRGMCEQCGGTGRRKQSMF